MKLFFTHPPVAQPCKDIGEFGDGENGLGGVVFADGVVEIHAGGGSEGSAIVGVLIVAGAEGCAKQLLVVNYEF